ncbi:MAG: ParB/RepB/Spo0J family partition protein, partial [Acidimicrobiales bacterium]
MAENRRLGRGLSTLIPTQKPKTDAAPEKREPAPAKRDLEPKKQANVETELPNSALRDVAVESIAKNPNQPRVHFDESALADLAKSIKEIGVLQPLLVRELSAGRYELIAGERRWRAAQIAKLKTVPVVVREVNELASVEQALVENLHREDLTALEEASAYQQLAEDFGLTHEQVAKRVGKSRAAVTNALRLLNLPATVQGYLADGRLQAGHARALLGCH